MTDPKIVRHEIRDRWSAPLPRGFKLAVAKAALDSPRLVWSAFIWDSTPQGEDFWANYCLSDLSMENEALAREALRGWIAIAERKKEGL